MRYATSALPFNPAMSVELLWYQAGLLEHGGEHDRGARVHRLGGPVQVPQNRLDALEIRRDDLEDVAVLARHVVALQHPGVLLHLAHTRLVPDVVGAAVAHGDERGDRKPDLHAIDARPVAGDELRLFQPFYTLHHGGPRQPNFVGHRLVARAPVDR